MRKLIFTLSWIVIAITVTRAQTINWVSLTPDNPIQGDTITAVVHVFSDNDDARKLSGTWTIAGDTIYYYGCYITASIVPTSSEFNDTIILSNLVPNQYRLIAIAQYIASNQDTLCAATNPAYNDTLDTTFVVSPYNVIEFTEQPSPQNRLLSYNRLITQRAQASLLNLRITDALGRICYGQSGIPVSAGTSTNYLPISSLPSGMYFYILEDEKSRTVLKWIEK